MPSNYSDLKFQLMVTGENSGTWGDVTNVNLGTAIEDALVGTGNAVFTSNAEYELPWLDTNGPQIARNLVLNVTSSVALVGTQNLVVPTFEKQYLIYNNTSGGQAINVKTSAGTGVIVPNGAKVFLYVDGVSVVPAINALPSSGTTTVMVNNIGYLNIPQNTKSTNYTLELSDAGKHIFHPAADITARTWTIPANSSVPFPIGTAIGFITDAGAGAITIAITSDTLIAAGTGLTGSRTLATNSIATAIKITNTSWIISGVLLT